MIDLTGKVAVVTGAAQGQGEAEARLFAELGAHVVVADIQEEAGRALAGELGSSAVFAHLDVSDDKAWEAAVRTSVETFGGLDILVNNAAAMRLVAIEDEDPAAFRRILDINVTGAFLGIRAVAPVMRAAGAGAIVNVSSASGLQGQAWASAYSASKWAIRGLTKTAAAELGSAGIRVNTLVPGPIRTAMLPEDRSGAERDSRFDRLPLGRSGDPRDVAHVAAFLASDAAAYVTGAEFVADGGMTAAPPAAPRPDKPILFH